jgi:hypothetical protein
VNNPLKKNLKLFLTRNGIAIEDLLAKVISPKALCNTVNRHKEYTSLDMLSKVGVDRPGDWEALKLGLVQMLQRKRNGDDGNNEKSR